MKRAVCIVLTFFVLAILGHSVSWAQYDGVGPSMDSSDLEEGREDMIQMDSSMYVNPGNSINSLGKKGMDVQSGGTIDFEGTGAR